MSRTVIHSTPTSGTRGPWRLRTLVLLAAIVAAGVHSLGGGPELLPDMLSGCVTDEQCAIRELRTIALIQHEFLVAAECGDGGRSGYAGSLIDLSDAGLVDEALGGGRKHGYVFDLTANGWTWSCTAYPETPEAGRLNFIIGTDAVVRSSWGAPATSTSPPVP